MAYKRAHSPNGEDDFNKRQRRDEPPHAESQAPRAAVYSNAMIVGPTSSTVGAEGITDHVLLLLGTCDFDFKGDMVSYVREGLFVRVTFASSSSAGRFVDLWRARKPLSNSDNMLTVRLATVRDTAMSAMGGSATTSAREAAIDCLFPKKN